MTDRDKEPGFPTALTGMSARLLLLTIMFVMLAEFLIYTPSISRYRQTYLEEHIATAHLATLALEATPDNMVSPELEEKLLFHAGAYSITLRQKHRRVMMLQRKNQPMIDVTYDLTDVGFIMLIKDAYAALWRDDNRIVRVISPSPKNKDVTVEVVLQEAPMRKAMLSYSTRILQLSIVISLLTAGLVYITLLRLMVRPMRKMTQSMIRFRDNPESVSTTIHPSQRSDEVGVAQRELATMQEEVRAALNQKSRLATLGAAVAKVNHDLRNSLATAVLASDRLADIDDPEVKRVMPRLYNAIDKAVNLCSQTLNYVSAKDVTLRPELFHLCELVNEVEASIREGSTDGKAFQVENKVDFSVDLTGDREQLFRVFTNLLLNARQAGAGSVTVDAHDSGEGISILIVDDGPGFSAKARDKMFQPFSGSGREGGSGLGLVIVHDLMRAHGGDIVLLKSDEKGTTFQLDLPKHQGV